MVDSKRAALTQVPISVGGVKKPPSTIGNYIILKTIGYGAFGVVKLVRSTVDNQEYAMKVFELDPAEKDRIHRSTQEEFDKIKQLNIANIPKYYEFVKDAVWTRSSGQERIVSYLLMENCQGLEMFEFVNEIEGIQNENLLRYIFKEIIKAVYRLHTAGVAHRDIKLENIMITRNYEVRLIDLGMFSTLAGGSKKGFFISKKGTP